MIVRVNILIGYLSLMFILGCASKSYQPGDIYSVEDGEGKIGIVKVLVVEPGIIHLRVYKNKFDERPKTINISELNLGQFGDAGGLGIEHLPLDIKGFKALKPKLLAFEMVTEEELIGFKIWKDNQ